MWCETQRRHLWTRETPCTSWAEILGGSGAIGADLTRHGDLELGRELADITTLPSKSLAMILSMLILSDSAALAPWPNTLDESMSQKPDCLGPKPKKSSKLGDAPDSRRFPNSFLAPLTRRRDRKNGWNRWGCDVTDGTCLLADRAGGAAEEESGWSGRARQARLPGQKIQKRRELFWAKNAETKSKGAKKIDPVSVPISLEQKTSKIASSFNQETIFDGSKMSFNVELNEILLVVWLAANSLAGLGRVQVLQTYLCL